MSHKATVGMYKFLFFIAHSLFLLPSIRASVSCNSSAVEVVENFVCEGSQICCKWSLRVTMSFSVPLLVFWLSWSLFQSTPYILWGSSADTEFLSFGAINLPQASLYSLKLAVPGW